MFLFGERGRFAPPGIVGGGPAAAINRFRYQQADGEHQPPMASKMVGIKHRGAARRVRLETPGGGGYGDAHERDPKAVARDVRLGYRLARRRR